LQEKTGEQVLGLVNTLVEVRTYPIPLPSPERGDLTTR